MSVQAAGESTFAVSRLSPDKKQFTVSVKRMGHLTKSLHRAAQGQAVGVRGPYGKPFPVEEWRGKVTVVIGGGIGQCGRCNIGPLLVCKDGPVFRIDQLPAYAL